MTAHGKLAAAADHDGTVRVWKLTQKTAADRKRGGKRD